MTPHKGRMVALVGAPLVLSGIVAFGGCNDDPTHFGPAGGLAGRAPDDQSPSADAGGSTSGEGGSSGTCAPGTPDAAGCPSFAADIFAPMLAAAGTYKCGNGVGCHGAGGAAPSPMADATSTLTLLKAAKVTGKTLPYVNAPCGDPTQSMIACNLVPTGTAGACGSHMPLSPPDVSAADLAKIKAWIACGSPP
jgi:hypothetical protein